MALHDGYDPIDPSSIPRKAFIANPAAVVHPDFKNIFSIGDMVHIKPGSFRTVPCKKLSIPFVDITKDINGDEFSTTIGLGMLGKKVVKQK